MSFFKTIMKTNDRANYFFRDLATITLGIVISVLLVKTGVLKDFLFLTKDIRFIDSFLAGIFFISIFTVAPAAVVLAELFRFNSILEVAFFASLGALTGDLVIFRFIKNTLIEDIFYLIKKEKRKKLKSIFKTRLFRWFTPLLGALIIASPLPDEIGIAMMGLSKMKTSLFIPISFALNFLGILIIGLIVRGLI